jgi:hypothetical protein
MVSVGHYNLMVFHLSFINNNIVYFLIKEPQHRNLHTK